MTSAAPSARRDLPAAIRRPQLAPERKALYARLDVPRADWHKPSGAIIAFAHSLVVPAGRYVNKPLRLRPFQIKFIRDVYNAIDEAGRRKARQAVLSVGRRNGKTLLAAVLLLAHLVGPLKRPNSTIVSAATTRKQAGIVYKFVADMVEANMTIRKRLKIIRSTKRIVHKRDSSSYEAISAEAGGAFGEGLDFVCYDELAQAKNRKLYDALMTSLGSQIEPLMMVISTQAPADDHILSELIDYGLKVEAGEFEDEAIVVHLHTAKDGCKLMNKREWKRANPALGDYRDDKELASQMQQATRMPSLEASLRNLYLNQRVQAAAPFLAPSVWKRCAGAVNENLLYDPDRLVYAGLDLSFRTDLSALVMAVEDDDGLIHLFPRIWTPNDTLAERGLRDRAPYMAWAENGQLIAVPGAVLNYDFLAQDIGDLTSLVDFAGINYDAWRINVFKQSLARLGIAVPIMPFSQSFKVMSPAIEMFEQLAIEGKLRHGNHPVLRWCVSNAVIDLDSSGNRKLAKNKSFGRIDAAVSAVMAVAAMKLQTDPPADVMSMVA